MPSSLKPRENQGEMPRPVPRIERPSGAVAVDSLASHQPAGEIAAYQRPRAERCTECA